MLILCLFNSFDKRFLVPEPSSLKTSGRVCKVSKLTTSDSLSKSTGVIKTRSSFIIGRYSKDESLKNEPVNPNGILQSFNDSTISKESK